MIFSQNVTFAIEHFFMGLRAVCVSYELQSQYLEWDIFLGGCAVYFVLYDAVYQFRLCWAVLAARAALQLRRLGFSLQWLLRWGVASRALRVQWLQRVNSVLSVPGLQSACSIVVAFGLRSFAACRIFPGQGQNPCLLHWLAVSFFATEPPGKPKVVCFFIS